MHIFMDEAGSFGGVGEFPSPSLVGALILPFLQTRWFRKPFKQIPIGDYSHLARCEVDADDWTKEMANWKEGDPKPLDLLAVLKEDFTFSAAASPGLELVDIITNATRQALVGTCRNRDGNGFPN